MFMNDNQSSGDLVEDLILSPLGEVLDGEAEALGCDLADGVDVGDWVALFLEEPLAHVLVVAWLGPGVVVDVEGLLLGLAVLLGRRRFGLLALCGFGFFNLLGAFELEDLVLALGLLARPDAEVADDADVLLEPVEVLGDEVVVDLAVVADDDIAVVAGADEVAYDPEAELVQVEEAEIVTDGQVLVEEGVVLLDEVDARLQQVLQQLLGDQHLLVEVDLVEPGQRALDGELIGPFCVFGDALLDLGRLLLAYLRIHVRLVLPPGPADELLLLHLQVEHGRRADYFDPIVHLLEVQVDAVDDQRRAAALSDEGVEVRDDLAEGKLLAVLRRDELLLDGGEVGLVLDVLVAELAGDVLGGSGFACAGRTGDEEVLLVGLELGVEGDVVFDLPALEALEEDDGGVGALAVLVVLGLHEVREELEVARVPLELVELLGLPGEVGEDDLAPVEVPEDHAAQYLHLLGLLALVGLPPEDGLDVEDVEQQPVGLLHVLAHDLALLGLVDVGVDELGQQLVADLADDRVDVLLSGDGVEAGPLLEGGHNGRLAVEVVLAAGQLRPLVLEVHDLEVEVGLEDGDLGRLGRELDEDVVFVLGVLADEVVGSDGRVDELVADVAEVVLV